VDRGSALAVSVRPKRDGPPLRAARFLQDRTGFRLQSLLPCGDSIFFITASIAFFTLNVSAPWLGG